MYSVLMPRPSTITWSSRHSICTGETAMRGGFTCRLGSRAMPSASISLSSGANSCAVWCITSMLCSVATFTTNSRLRTMLCAVSLVLPLPGRLAMLIASMGGLVAT